MDLFRFTAAVLLLAAVISSVSARADEERDEPQEPPQLQGPQPQVKVPKSGDTSDLMVAETDHGHSSGNSYHKGGDMKEWGDKKMGNYHKKGGVKKGSDHHSKKGSNYYKVNLYVML